MQKALEREPEWEISPIEEEEECESGREGRHRRSRRRRWKGRCDRSRCRWRRRSGVWGSEARVWCKRFVRSRTSIRCYPWLRFSTQRFKVSVLFPFSFCFNVKHRTFADAINYQLLWTSHFATTSDDVVLSRSFAICICNRSAWISGSWASPTITRTMAFKRLA